MKILVVEDDPIVAQTLQILLSSYNYAVDIAADGETGLQLTDAFDYDLILLDVLLPKLDGISLCQQLRNQGFQSPILLLTGQGEGRQKAIALNAGADDYVVKPFDAEELIARVHALLRRSNSAAQPMLTWGELCVDPSSRNVTYGTHLLNLTPKEYAILELFLRNPQRVFSAEAILDHAWNSVESPGEEAVRVHIKELRHKFQSVGAPKDFIKTIHRIGYRLNPLYSSILAEQTKAPLTLPQIAELQSVNQELRAALEQLQATQEELRHKNQELEKAYQTIAQEQRSLQHARDELEQRVAARTAELVTANQSLQQQQQFLSSIYEVANQGIFIVDVTETKDFRYTSFNRVALQYSRINPEDMQGKTPEAAFGYDIGSRFRKNYQHCLQSGTSIAYEEHLIFEDQQIWTLTTLSPLRNEQGEIHRIVGTAIEITDRKNLELSLQASEAKLSQILDTAIAAIISFRIFRNQDWEYNYFSTGCEVLFGYTSQEFMTDKALWLSRIFPEDRENLVEPLFQSLFTEPKITIEYRFYHQDGSIRWISSTYASQQIDVNSWLITAVNHDITDRKQAEFMLQQQILREQLIADISRDIRRSLDLNNVLSRTVERVRQLLNTDRVIIFRFRPDWHGEVIMESVGANWTPILSTTIFDPCFRDRYIDPYRQGKVAKVDNIEENLAPCYVELLQTFQVKANLVVPILQADNLWGLLIAHHCASPRHWQTSEIDLLRQLALQLGIAIQQSELYQQTRRELLERERMQTVLEDSEERFRILSTTVPIGICQMTADGICLYTNARWQEMSGLSFEESLGNGWLQAVHPEDREMLSTAWDSYMQGKSEILPEFRLLTPQKQIRWISAHAATMRSATGEILGYVSINEDITERKSAEQKIREQAALLDITSDAIFVHDLEHQILYWNQGAERLYGWQATEAIGQKVDQLLHAPNAPADQLEMIMQTLLDQGKWRGEIRKVTKTGKEVLVEARWTLVRTAAGQPKFILSVDTDITDQKHLEAQFYHAQRLESIGTLATGIAHDLNNVLTPILGIAQLLRLQWPNQDMRSQEMLQVLEDSAKRGANMAKQILTFTRGTSGERRIVQVAPLLQEVLNVIQQTFPKSIIIRQSLPANLPAKVLADPTHLHQIFMNLCINARDAMPNGGVLTLALENCWIDQSFAQRNLDAKVGNYVVITVTDTGIGIPIEVRDRIFDPFFTTKASGQGTGLGLSTVLGIVRGYGGFLQVSSQLQKGSQFKVYLPATEATPTEASPPEKRFQGNGELVLIVDDDPAVQQTNQALLEAHHYTTLIANNGVEAIALYARNQAEIKVVLIDVMMPTMDGITAVQTLREINTNLKIIAISGLASNREPVLTAGANLFLTKPYMMETLLGSLYDLVNG